LAGRKTRIVCRFRHQIGLLAPRTLLLFAATQIFPQSGSQTLFAIRRLSHHPAPILIPIHAPKPRFGIE
jgi:hypothetical protein